MDDVLLSPQQVAEHYGVTRKTVYAMVADGRLRKVKIGRMTRIPRSSVEALVITDQPA